VFKQGDITIDEAKRRIEGTSTEEKERGKRFVESLASTSPSQPPSISGSRMFLVGNWKDWIGKKIRPKRADFLLFVVEGDQFQPEGRILPSAPTIMSL
jgi:hypothetical protein